MHNKNHAKFVTMLLLAALPIGGAAAEGLKPIEYTLGDGTVIRFSGQLNMGVLHYDDGQDDFTNFVDNDNSSSRARLQIFSTSGDWKFESTLEAEYQPLASNVVSQLNRRTRLGLPCHQYPEGRGCLRQRAFREALAWSGEHGQRRDGRGRQFRHRRSSLIPAISDTAGGYFFRFAGDGLSDVTVGSSFSNFDGLGRKLRVRYDTPTFHGFGLRTSYGEDALAGLNNPLYDVAAVYGGDFEQVDLDAAIAFSRNEGSDTDILYGSISGLHKPTGLSLTLAGGREYNDSVEGRYGYVKLGYQHQFFDMGSTAFSVDYYFGNDIAAADSDSASVGLAAVQNIDDYNLQLWALWRNYDYEDDNWRLRRWAGRLRRSYFQVLTAEYLSAKKAFGLRAAWTTRLLRQDAGNAIYDTYPARS